MNNILNKEQIADLKINGHRLALILQELEKNVKAGVSALDIENLSERLLKEQGLRPSFKNYFVYGAGNYPACTCISVNEEIVHGIPRKNKVFKEGDIVSIDFGAEYKGVYSDMAITIPVGKISEREEILLAKTKESLSAGIEAAVAGNHIGHIGHAVESVARSSQLGIVQDYVGHGIGQKPHLPPQIPNYGNKGEGIKIVEGMALAIEPMFTLGSGETDLQIDGWTVTTADRSKAAHFEHTIVIENGKPVIITK